MRSGSSETDVKELAVMPCTRPGARSTVITVTPVVNAPATRRNITGLREEMAIALSFQDNTAARGGAKGGDFFMVDRQQNKDRSPRGALFSYCDLSLRASEVWTSVLFITSVCIL